MTNDMPMQRSGWDPQQGWKFLSLAQLSELTGMTPKAIRVFRESLPADAKIATVGSGPNLRLNACQFVQLVLERERNRAARKPAEKPVDEITERIRRARMIKAEAEAKAAVGQWVDAEAYEQDCLRPFCDAIRQGMQRMMAEFPTAASIVEDVLNEARRSLLTSGDEGPRDDSFRSNFDGPARRGGRRTGCSSTSARSLRRN